MSLTIFANDEPAEPPRKDDEPGNPGGATVLEAKPKTKKPSMYKVLLLNDDYTPMEFVIIVL
ncbi:MAG TPA: ATP-dependent Clp protease adapter ClpS, partial [Alphaproteobacteria bacterium]|nr:ATP-dependent Clp protease adapter ClpS [Alphaproteobacteria bacterium]